MQRRVTTVVGILLFLTLGVAIAWMVVRFSGGSEQTVRALTMALKIGLGIIVVLACYAAAVGIYHTFLAITGLDEEKDE